MMGEQAQRELERQKLILVELPNLIHRILHLSMLPYSYDKKYIALEIEEIKKVTNAECKSALEYFEDLLIGQT